MRGWYLTGDGLEYWSERYWFDCLWRQPLRPFRSYAWGFSRRWGGFRWALFLGWFVIARNA